MMFSDEEIKESSLMRPGDEIISIREVCLIDKYDKKYLGNEPLLSNSSRNELEVPRLFRDGFFSEGLDPQARFAWTEEDGNIASLVSEPGFGTTGQTTFGTDLDAALTTEIKVCNKTFNRVSTLISHRKTHSDEKPYKCHICPKGFHQKGNLRNHLFTHTNERPYRCNICMKGFNQQSNLVCHKNKAHPDENNVNTVKSRNAPRVPILSATETQTDLTRPPSDQCEVSSSVGPYLPPDQAISIWPKPIQFNASRLSSVSSDLWNESPWGSNGVIVDPINTYHMGIALATRQTPFALLKSDNGTPVLVKVVDTKLPGGKQMLVPATAEDLKIGGKIVLNKEVALATTSEVNSAVQIRVPVVATVVPKIRPGGKLQLSVEEPHHVYHNTLSSNGGEQKENSCTASAGPSIPTNLPPLEPLRRLDLNLNEHNIRTSRSYSPAPSSPLDLISLDLFEPIGCIPLGPQITSVDNIEQPPPSEDSDIFIEKFEEIIPLSDSD
nr:uncharacterized protein LOC113397645 [Vanessa tameamea]